MDTDVSTKKEKKETKRGGNNKARGLRDVGGGKAAVRGSTRHLSLATERVSQRRDTQCQLCPPIYLHRCSRICPVLLPACFLFPPPSTESPQSPLARIFPLPRDTVCIRRLSAAGVNMSMVFGTVPPGFCLFHVSCRSAWLLLRNSVSSRSPFLLCKSHSDESFYPSLT